MVDYKKFYTEKELIKLTQNLIKIPSHKGAKNEEHAIAKFIHKYARKNKLNSKLEKVVGKRHNVIATLKGTGEGKNLILNGHTDTVGPEGMTINPFEGFVKEGFIWGRGAVDMKGPIASMLMAMIAIKRSGIKLRGDVIFTGVIGEEGKSEGTEHLVNTKIEADGAIVGEPSNYEYAVGHRGLEWFDVIIKGKASHSGQPEKGVNAIEKAMMFIERVKRDLSPKLRERYDEYMGESLMNLGTIQGGTGQSTVADNCIIRIDRRYISGETVESVMQEYQDIIDQLHEEDPYFVAEIRQTPEAILELNHPPLITSINEHIVSVVRESMKETMNFEPNIARGFGWSDAALLKTYLGIPTIVCGPGDLSLAHTEEERITIEDLVNFTEIYANIIEKFCG